MKDPNTAPLATSQSWSKLAEQLLTTDRSLRQWRTRPGAPQTKNLSEWQNYVRDEGLGRPKDKELIELKKDVERERWRKLRRENEVAEGKLLPREILEPYLRNRASTFAAVCRVILEKDLPPRLQGAPIAEIRTTMCEAVDLLIHRYNTTFDAERIEADVIADGG